MRKWIVVAVLALSLVPMRPVSVRADPADEISAVIDAQIAAFRADDFTAAFEHASPAIRRLFGSPARFGAMVRQGYPMVWRPDDVTYLDLRPVGGEMWQTVLIRDRAGAYHTLVYQMLPGENGWRINGVRLLEGDAVGA